MFLHVDYSHDMRVRIDILVVASLSRGSLQRVLVLSCAYKTKFSFSIKNLTLTFCGVSCVQLIDFGCATDDCHNAPVQCSGTAPFMPIEVPIPVNRVSTFRDFAQQYQYNILLPCLPALS